jgi:cyanate permease
MISFTVTNFVPSAARATFGLDAAAAGWLISTGYLLAMGCNLAIGYLMDRADRWTIMSVIALLLIPASLLLTMHDLAVFRIATALTLALGFTATNQVYALAREVMDAHDAAGAIGALGLGAGVFAYVGPQALGVLRDHTGGFAVGWYVMAGTATVALLVLLTLRRVTRTRG